MIYQTNYFFLISNKYNIYCDQSHKHQREQTWISYYVTSKYSLKNSDWGSVVVS